MWISLKTGVSKGFKGALPCLKGRCEIVNRLKRGRALDKPVENFGEKVENSCTSRAFL